MNKELWQADDATKAAWDMLEALKDETNQEATTIAFKLSDGRAITMAQAREVSDRIMDPENWKAPCAALVSASGVEMAMKVLEFYHGGKARMVGLVYGTGGKVLIESDGYCC
jgi:hypothetical protein